jgi:YVTN family beta-propeller protein
MRHWIRNALSVSMGFAALGPALAGQAPMRASDADVPISHNDRVYAAEQFSNTVSVIDPADNRLLGVIRLGEPAPDNFSPLYRGHPALSGYSRGHSARSATTRSGQATGEQAMQPPSIEGLIVIPTQHSVAEVLSRTNSIAQARGIKVFATIDFSADAVNAKLMLRPTGLVILGNPAAGTPVMAVTPTAAIDLPLKILAFEDAEGQKWVGYNDPNYLQRRHGFSEALVGNLEPIGRLARIIAGTD